MLFYVPQTDLFSGRGLCYVVPVGMSELDSRDQLCLKSNSFWFRGDLRLGKSLRYLQCQTGLHASVIHLGTLLR